MRNKLFRPELHPKLRATLKLPQAWSANPKQVKASIINTPRCPAFPDWEWLNLVQGKTINLDSVFSSFYSTSTDNQCTENIGEVKFKFGTKDSSKPVTTHGDWTITFDLTHMYTSSCSLTEQRSLSSTKDTFCNISPPPSGNPNTLESSPLTRLSESGSWSGTTYCCLTSTSLVTSDPCTLTTLVLLNQVEHLDLQLLLPQTGLPFESVMRHVRTGTKECVTEKNCFYLHICKLSFKKGHTSNKCPTKGATGSSGS